MFSVNETGSWKGALHLETSGKFQLNYKIKMVTDVMLFLASSFIHFQDQNLSLRHLAICIWSTGQSMV